MEERDRRRDELRRSLRIKSARRSRRQRRGGLLGTGGAPVYIALFVVITGFTVYVTITSLAEGLYLGGGVRLVISAAMLGLLYYVIRSRI